MCILCTHIVVSGMWCEIAPGNGAAADPADPLLEVLGFPEGQVVWWCGVRGGGRPPLCSGQSLSDPGSGT